MDGFRRPVSDSERGWIDNFGCYRERSYRIGALEVERTEIPDRPNELSGELSSRCVCGLSTLMWKFPSHVVAQLKFICQFNSNLQRRVKCRKKTRSNREEERKILKDTFPRHRRYDIGTKVREGDRKFRNVTRTLRNTCQKIIGPPRTEAAHGRIFVESRHLRERNGPSNASCTKPRRRFVF